MRTSERGNVIWGTTTRYSNITFVTAVFEVMAGKSHHTSTKNLITYSISGFTNRFDLETISVEYIHVLYQRTGGSHDEHSTAS